MSFVADTKSRLVDLLKTFASDNDLTQKDMAELLGITQPRVSNLMNGQVEKFSLEALLGYAESVDFELSLIIE